MFGQRYSPPREEGWLRHQENFGEAHLSAADGVVAHTDNWLESDHPGRSAATPPREEGNKTLARYSQVLRSPNPLAIPFENATGMPRDHQFLIRAHDSYRNGAARG